MPAVVSDRPLTFTVRGLQWARALEFAADRQRAWVAWLGEDHELDANEAGIVTSREIWTIGHWTCPEPAFLQPLHMNEIRLLADVRAQPGSRRNPQFGRDAMPGWLARAGIDYVHLPELGGRRRKQDVDPGINAGWRQPSFKNYADYTLGPEYRNGIETLTSLASKRRVAIMCGEPMPWRCHRLLIANTLVAQGWTVWHLIGNAEPRRHELGQWGAAPSVDPDGHVTYPAA